jgi:acylphosphatase
MSVILKGFMTSGKIRRLEMRIHGRVQGVFFRAETRSAARALGLTGMVRNEPDGTVRVIAEGPENVLRQLKTFCHKGPPSATVHDVEESWQESTGSFHEFEIAY